MFGFLNHGAAGYVHMSISELNASGQPYAQFFRITELLSGILLFLAITSLAATIRIRGLLLLSSTLIAFVGLLTVYDALHNVDCNPYENAECTTKMLRGDISNTNKDHDTESLISTYTAGSLTIIVMVMAILRRNAYDGYGKLELHIVATITIGVLLSLILHYKSNTYNELCQRLFNMLLSLEFIYITYRVYLLQNQRRISGSLNCRHTSLV
jgi:hypothetical protein